MPRYSTPQKVRDRKRERYVKIYKVGDHATNMPSAVWFGNVADGKYVIRENVKYAYDQTGNINKIYKNGEMTVRYTYDKLSRLVREDNKSLGKTWLYAYDSCGNIISKREFGYTLLERERMEEQTENEVKQYAYDGDRLIRFGTETFAYDNMGNPTTYRGKAATWSKGRQLQRFNGISFTYDAQGRRMSKGNIAYYYDSDGRIIKQSDGLEFIYDNSGVVGVKYNGTQYLYRKDAQGNVIAILDNTGVVVIQYSYDAWGNHSVEVVNSSCTTLANLNPFRYRSYYFDTETKLYFLQTRYYDPEVGRFITIDSIRYAVPKVINGLNLYAYCGNNPVMGYDPMGTWDWSLFWDILVTAGSVVVGVFVGRAVGVINVGLGFAAGVATTGAINNLVNAIYVATLDGQELKDAPDILEPDSYSKDNGFQYITRWDRLKYAKQQAWKQENSSYSNVWRYYSEYSFHMYAWMLFSSHYTGNNGNGFLSDLANSAQKADVGNTWEPIYKSDGSIDWKNILRNIAYFMMGMLGF